MGCKGEFVTWTCFRDVNELSSEDPSFSNFVRMDVNDFEVTPYIERNDTNMREAISVSERLSLTLRFLATGDSYHSLEYQYRIPLSTLSEIIQETCQAIQQLLQSIMLNWPL